MKGSKRKNKRDLLIIKGMIHAQPSATYLAKKYFRGNYVPLIRAMDDMVRRGYVNEYRLDADDTKFIWAITVRGYNLLKRANMLLKQK